MKNMKQKTLGLAIALALGGGVGTASAQVADAGVGGGPVTPAGGADPILYDQTDNASGNGAPDQDFEAGYDTYDSEGADDFMVTDSTGWLVTGVDTVGTTGTPGAAMVNISFLADSGGAPGAVVCDYTGIVPVDTAGSFGITLPSPCVLDGGQTYWLRQQTNQNFAANGQHFWSNRSVQTGNPGHWRNPNDGFSTGCTDWAPMAGTNDGNPATGCGIGGGVNPDFLFAIRGTVNVNQIVPTLGPAGLGLLGLAMVGGGLMAMRRKRKS